MEKTSFSDLMDSIKDQFEGLSSADRAALIDKTLKENRIEGVRKCERENRANDLAGCPDGYQYRLRYWVEHGDGSDPSAPWYTEWSCYKESC